MFFFMAGRGPQSTHWAFTCHHYTCIPLRCDIPEGVQYLVFQEELPPSNAMHIQGYIQFEQKQRGSFVTALISRLFEPEEGEPHTEPAKGSDEDNETYCTKPETRCPGSEPYRYGERVPHAGKKGGRSDLIAVQRQLDAGESLRTVAKTHFSTFIRYERGLRNYKRLMQEPRNAPPEIFVHIGPTGCGKTRHVRETFPDAYWHPGGKWWDDYDGEAVVVFDEFYGHKISFTQLLSILDWGTVRVETKGGSALLCSTTFVFTSNQDPQDWYSAERTHQPDWIANPLKRRLDEFGFITYWHGWRREVPAPPIIYPPAAACQYCAIGNCAFHHL